MSRKNNRGCRLVLIAGRCAVILLGVCGLQGCGLLPYYPAVVDDERVSGVVVDVEGNPLPGAAVIVYTQKNSIWGPTSYRFRRYAITGENGAFEILPDARLVKNAGTFGYDHGKPHLLAIHPDYSAQAYGAIDEQYLADLRLVLKVHPFSLEGDNACFDIDDKHCACIKHFIAEQAWTCN